MTKYWKIKDGNKIVGFGSGDTIDYYFSSFNSSTPYTIEVVDSDGNSGSSVYTTNDCGNYVPVMGVSIDDCSPSGNQLYLNTKSYLHATVSPSNATSKDVIWESSDSSVVSINKRTGLISGVSLGNSTITVKTTDKGFSATCNVNVISASCDSIVIPVTEKEVPWSSGSVVYEGSIPESFTGFTASNVPNWVIDIDTNSQGIIVSYAGNYNIVKRGQGIQLNFKQSDSLPSCIKIITLGQEAKIG